MNQNFILIVKRIIKAVIVAVPAGFVFWGGQELRADTEETRVLKDFMFIKGGTFTMGSPYSEPERFYDETQHRVTVSSFYMGKYEVTQEEWRNVMGDNPSYFKGDNLPVESVSWYDAIEYCNKRSELEGLTPAYTIDKSSIDSNNKAPSKGEYEWEYDNVRWTVTWNRDANGYRLPTEAEWEYACRARITKPFNTGDNITTSQANYNGNYPYNKNAKGIYREGTTIVGTFAPNNFGLYDMHGNVWEWCWDWWNGDYSGAARKGAVGAAFGAARVYRGGSWNGYGRGLRSADRGRSAPTYRGINLGIRLALPEQ